jgi:hypothetical protein
MAVVLCVAAVAFVARPDGDGGSSPAVPAVSEPVTAGEPAVADTAAAPHHLVVYYFHTNYRCSSCRKIEAYAHRALETGFAAELADGRMEWRVVNVEEAGNEHFVKDYQLYTKSVVLSDLAAGKEVRWKNLPKVWELLNDEAGFVEYVQTETHAYLDAMP